VVRPGAAGLRGLFVLAVLMLLSGCLKLDADLAVGADDTVSGRYVVAYVKDPARPSPGLAPPRELLVSRGSAQSRRYDDGTYAGTEYELRSVSFSDLAAFAAVQQQDRQTGTLRLARDGDDVKVSGLFDFRDTRPVSRTPKQRADAERLFSVRVRLTFPADVYAANGRIDGRTVTWDIPPFQLTTLSARAGALPLAPPATDSGPAVGAVVGTGLGGLAILLAIVLLVRRRRRPTRAAAPPADAADFAWVLGDRAPPPARPAPPPWSGDLPAPREESPEPQRPPSPFRP
jgi:hypothetical protein